MEGGVERAVRLCRLDETGWDIYQDSEKMKSVLTLIMCLREKAFMEVSGQEIRQGRSPPGYESPGEQRYAESSVGASDRTDVSLVRGRVMDDDGHGARSFGRLSPSGLALPLISPGGESRATLTLSVNVLDITQDYHCRSQYYHKPSSTL